MSSGDNNARRWSTRHSLSSSAIGMLSPGVRDDARRTSGPTNGIRRFLSFLRSDVQDVPDPPLSGDVSPLEPISAKSLTAEAMENHDKWLRTEAVAAGGDVTPPSAKHKGRRASQRQSEQLHMPGTQDADGLPSSPTSSSSSRKGGRGSFITGLFGSSEGGGTIGEDPTPSEGREAADAAARPASSQPALPVLKVKPAPAWPSSELASSGAAQGTAGPAGSPTRSMVLPATTSPGGGPPSPLPGPAGGSYHNGIDRRQSGGSPNRKRASVGSQLLSLVGSSMGFTAHNSAMNMSALAQQERGKVNLEEALTEQPVSEEQILALPKGGGGADEAAGGGGSGGGGEGAGDQARGSEEDPDESASDSDESEAEGEYTGGKGDFLTSRYRIEEEVGRGTFGRVLSCADKKTSRRVAIKVVHDAGRYYELSLIEAEILRDVNALGGRGQSHCVMLLNFFKFQGHACMVFETLGLSLYEFLKENDYIPFPLYCVQDFARQMLEAIAFLHSMKLIHTDLKPENVLLVDARYRVQQVGRKEVRIPERTQIKLIDFGCATYDDDEHKSELIATRQYRAPEVIMGLPWSFPSDIWSIGCIVAELYCGDQLFETHSNMEHVALIERGVGKWPANILEQSSQTPKYFDPRNGMCLWRTALNAESRRHVRSMKTLEDFVGEDKDTGLLSLFRGMLHVDPDHRISADRALAKSFIRNTKRPQSNQK
uniref:Protein kinase domain-containing protein n=1 Tax=Rhizochromulina marina TaxID=1034831 RepID=A0A7S2W9U9_9STRA|mmetsp:Transcript_17889/g.52248  ORF Transcript_17889/g.52248 Transcript_17889/m.52248 type:complete len:712 (+) Transcript_17889:247-2382(+)